MIKSFGAEQTLLQVSQSACCSNPYLPFGQFLFWAHAQGWAEHHVVCTAMSTEVLMDISVPVDYEGFQLNIPTMKSIDCTSSVLLRLACIQLLLLNVLSMVYRIIIVGYCSIFTLTSLQSFYACHPRVVVFIREHCSAELASTYGCQWTCFMYCSCSSDS